MKITDVRSHVLEAPLSETFSWSFDRTAVRTSCVVEVRTDTGLVGWGECFGPARLNAAVVQSFAPKLAGQDPLRTDAIWQQLYNGSRDQGRKGLMVTAISGIDIALWDLKGKFFGAPVSVLLGGPLRTRVKAYATGTYRRGAANPADYIVPEVLDYVGQGFQAVKIKIGHGVDEDVELVRLVRKAVGPKIGLMLDANHGYDVLEAVKLGRLLEDQDIGWFEEPVVPEDLDGYCEVRAKQPIPVAGGECEFTRWGFRDILARRAIDILQPDTCAAGGISECKKIADMANAFGIRYAPHVWGTAIGMSAALQLLAVLPHNPPRHTPIEPWLEFDCSEHPFREAVVREAFTLENGMVRIPDRPGLGIDVDETALERFRAA